MVFLKNANIDYGKNINTVACVIQKVQTASIEELKSSELKGNKKNKI